MPHKITTQITINGKVLKHAPPDDNTVKAMMMAFYGALASAAFVADYQATVGNHAKGNSQKLTIQAKAFGDGGEFSILDLTVGGQDAASLAAFEAHAQAALAPYAPHLIK